MRRSHMTALIASLCLSVTTLAAASTTAAAQTDAAQCGRIGSPPSGISGTLQQCTWDDGRIRVAGTLRDTALSDGATLLTLRIGLYSRQWVICGSDTPVDTDYQAGGAVGWTYRSVSTDRC